MRYVVATIGALFVFCGGVLAIMALPLVLFPVIYEHAAGVIVMYAVGIPLAAFGAVLSFRATLRVYQKPAGRQSETVKCSQCGEPVPPGAEKCPVCGAAMVE